MEQPWQIGKQLRMIHNRLRELGDRNLQKYNLTSAQLDVLIYLKKNSDGQICQRQIERWFQLKNPTVTGLLNRLEEKGFIARRTNPEDKRYRVVELTEKGEQLLEQLWEEAVQAESRMYSCLTEEERDMLSSFLDRILQNLPGI